MVDYAENQFISIKSWAEEDRPREKLMLKGRHALSDAELLAILLATGTKSESAVSLAQKMLSQVNNDLNELGKRSIKELQKLKGIGSAKAITIAAAMELGRRRQLTDVKIRPQVTCSKDAYHAIGPHLADLNYEEFWILMLNRTNRIIGKAQISIGGVAGTVVDPKMVFRKALEELACSIILCHNHPSGNPKPSQADLELTQKLKQAGLAIEIPIFDHLIITEKSYFSFADDGIL
ncbi:MAG TPA: DNA repair protein RadC [Saprospiraceae bacterium]|nr:DNA repair protein RadC [Saprospiraceae bacterium]HMQ83503.1 DNA repair protein RadC [Saprospiraceae bacterium]